MHATNLVSTFSGMIAPLVVAGLWHGLVIALAVALCLSMMRSLSGAQRFLVWSSAFITVALLPLLPFALRVFGSAGASAAPAANAAASRAWLHLDPLWTLVLASLWLVSSLLRAADLGFHVIRLRRLWHTAIPIQDPAFACSARGFEICTTQFLDRPSVIGFFRPRVLIPEWLLQRLSPEEFTQIVLHESTHLARRDDWTNLFQKLMLVCFPLNPGLWWMDRQLAKEREMACDEAVVHITHAPRAYAACLASLAERGMAHRREALSLGAWQRRSELVNRVQRILRRPRSLSTAAARVLLGVFGCGLAGGSIELARCPQLVAFVPAAHTTVAVNSSAQLGDAVYPDQSRKALLTGAHIVETRAEMQETRLAKRASSRARRKTAAVGELRATLGEPGAREPLSKLPTRSQTPEAAQQIIVFTAWEQVETVPATQGVVSDYDTQTSSDPNAATQSDTSSQSRPQMTTGNRAMQGTVQHRQSIAPLVLRIVPLTLKPSQPTAISIGNGWFVIQL